LSSLSASTTYYFNLTICDWAHNCITNGTNSFTTSAATVADTTTSGGGSGSSATPAALSAGLTKTFSTGDVLTFKLDSQTQSHTFLLLYTKGNNATIQIASKPQIATLSVGEIKQFDITEDGVNDLEVKLNSVSGIKADFTIKQINVTVAGTTGTTGTTGTGTDTTTGSTTTTTGTTESSTGKVLMWVGIGIVIIILAWIIIVFLKKKH